MLDLIDTVASAPAPQAPETGSTVPSGATFNILSKSALRASESARIGEALTTLLDAALVETKSAAYAAGRGAGSDDVAYKRIGAGYIGMECDRALGFRFHKVPKEERESVVSPGQLNRHAEAGHWTEDKMAEWFRLVGFGLETFARDGNGQPIVKADGTYKQIGWKALRNSEGKNQIAGEVDGVFTSVPSFVPEEYADSLGVVVEMLKPPFIWESKKATSKKIKKFAKDGVRKNSPEYFGQMQINMNMLKVEATLFTMMNLDAMDFYFEIVRYDPEYTGKIMDRAIRVTKSESPFDFSPISTSDKAPACMFCDWQATCRAGKQ